MDQALQSPRKKPLWRRLLLWLLSAFMVVVLAVLLLLGWLLGSESGLRTASLLVGRLTDQQVRIVEPGGRLAGKLVIPQIEISFPGLTVDIRALTLDWDFWHLFSGELLVNELAAQSVTVSSAPSVGSDTDHTLPTVPEAIHLPLDVALNRLTLDEFALKTWSADMPLAERESLFQFRQLQGKAQLRSDALTVDTLQVLLPEQSAVPARLTAALRGNVNLGIAPFPLDIGLDVNGQYEQHEFNARLTAQDTIAQPALTLALNSGASSAELKADLLPFATVMLKQATLAAHQLNPALFYPEAPQGLLDLQAEVASQSTERWQLSAKVDLKNHQPAPLDQAGIPLETLALQAHWTPEKLDVPTLALGFGDQGGLRGQVQWDIPSTFAAVSEQGLGRVEANIQLDRLQTQYFDTQLPAAQLDGVVKAQSQGVEQTAEIDLSLGKATVRGNGRFILAQGQQPASFAAEGKIRDFEPGLFVPEAPQASLNLDFSTQGTLAETIAVNAEWMIPESSFQSLPLTGQGKLALQGQRLSQADVTLTVAGNTLNTRGAVGQEGDRLTFALNAPTLAKLGLDVSGQVKAEGTVSGELPRPDVILQLTAGQLHVADALRVDGLEAQAQISQGLVRPSDVAVTVTGLGDGKGAQWLTEARLHLQGSLEDHVLSLAAQTPQQDQLALELAGGVDVSKQQWSGMLEKFESAGRFIMKLQSPAALALSPKEVSLATTTLDAGHQGLIELTQTRWRPDNVVARGHISGLVVDFRHRRVKQRATSRQPLQLGMDWDITLGRTLDARLHLFREAGNFMLDTKQVSLRLDLEKIDVQVDARDRQAQLNAVIQGQQVGTLQANMLVPLQHVSGLQWQPAEKSAMDGAVQLEMPSISWIGGLLQDNFDLDGSLSARVDLSGPVSQPQWSGFIEGKALQVAMLDQGVHLNEGHLRADFDQNRLTLGELSFQSDSIGPAPDARIPADLSEGKSGGINVSGELALSDLSGQFNIAVERLVALQSQDMWMMLSGKGNIDLQPKKLKLAMNMGVDGGYIGLPESSPPSISSDVVVIGKEKEAENKDDEGVEVTGRIAVNLGDHLYLSAMGLDSRLAGGIDIDISQGMKLAAVGTVNTVEGKFTGYGQNLTLERGLINFQGELNNPGLNILALRKGLQVEAGIEVTGSARQPRIRLVSTPDVPDPDKLSWIVLGRGPSGGSGADLGGLLPAAQALMGLGGGGPGITDRIGSNLGLDQFGIGQGELGAVDHTATSSVVGDGSTVSSDAATSSQVLAMGKRLSDNLYLSFEQGLGSADTLLKLAYSLTRNLSVVVRGGTDTSSDIYYTISFR